MRLLWLLCGICSVSAHNWLTSPARGNANDNFNGWTSPPCPQKSSRVHVQVAAGQRFPVEWASGHGYGSYTYLVVLAAKDSSHMIEHTMALLDKYLKAAPTPALTHMKDTTAMHTVIPNQPLGASSLGAEVTMSFWPGGRPASFRSFSGTMHVYNKTAQATANDKRAAYTNPDMPWILAVHKYALHEDKPEEMDMAFVEIPVGNPSGQYIVQYLWNGYYDCVDVNLLPSTSSDVFGTKSANTSLDKIDHCFFTPNLNSYQVQATCLELKQGDLADICLNACAKSNDQYSGCEAVQVSPVKLPSAAKFKGMHQSGQSHLPPNCATGNFANDSVVCYPIRIGQTPVVGPPYKIVTDPEDPVFYSTCYRKKPAWSFADACPTCTPAPPKPTFKFGDKCITCRDMYANAAPIVPSFWNFTDPCFDCDGTLG